MSGWIGASSSRRWRSGRAEFRRIRKWSWQWTWLFVSRVGWWETQVLVIVQNIQIAGIAWPEWLHVRELHIRDEGTWKLFTFERWPSGQSSSLFRHLPKQYYCSSALMTRRLEFFAVVWCLSFHRRGTKGEGKILPIENWSPCFHTTDSRWEDAPRWTL